MAVHVEGILEKSLNDKVKECKILVVGAGGIGCELLKNLVLTGFEDIHVVDLDTIELSNLNRQFLFHKQHIGRPKAIVAKESVLKFNPKANIIAYHDSITNTKYDVEFFKQFTLVTNALDNVAARSHVNRMCIAADVPLIESGSAGYLGQVTVYKKKVSECFECLPRNAPKSYPGCTIRNTPSEPVHCIVWSKHLFNQLFGETDIDEEVSPDYEDPALANSDVDFVERISTTAWAKETNYDPFQIFNKLFMDDIKYLHTMSALWEKRKRPEPLDWKNLPDAVPGGSQETESHIKDRIVWSVKQCAEIFASSMKALKTKLEEEGENATLTFDKDDEVSMDFVAACSNLRSYCFNIPQLCKFDVKAIAGNIVPAIATTNAVVSGLIVLQAIKVLQGDFKKCRTAWLNESYRGAKKLISSTQIEKPRSKCFVCSPKIPEITVRINPLTFTVRTLEEKVLKEKLHMVQPDVIMNDGTGSILISSDPDEVDEKLKNKILHELKISADSRLSCEDYFQHYRVNIVIQLNPILKDQEFEFEHDVMEFLKLHRQQEEDKVKEKEQANSNNRGSASDIQEIEYPTSVRPVSPIKKRLTEEDNGVLPPAKKAKTSTD